jgi:RNA polymerase sigma-70 factor (ECF subfamily)
MAARAFISRFQNTVFGVALAASGDPDAAEDIAQQAFEHAWRHAGLYDARRGSVRAWLRAITHNLAVDAARIRTQIPIPDEDLQNLLGAATDDPAAHALTSDVARELHRALIELPSEQARAVVLAAIHGLSATEIARAEAIPLGTAKARVRAGLAKLHSYTTLHG